MKLDMNYRIMEKLRLMRHNNVLCDLEVHSRDGIKHHVHSCVWAAAFEDCRTLLSNKYKGCLNENNKIIHLSTIDAEVLSTIVDFIYGEEISSIPVGLDGGLKQLGFQGFRYYLTNALSDSVCNETNFAQSSPVSNNKLRDLHTSDLNCNSGHLVQDHVKNEIVQDDVHNSLSSQEVQNSQGESTKNGTTSVEVKLEPVESISEDIGEENDDQMSNIKIYSKPGDDDQTVTVCVEYNCSVDNEDTGECVEQNQETQLPVLSTSQEKDKESALNEKSHKEQREDITYIKNNTSADAPQNNQSVVKDPKQVPLILSSPTTANTSLDSSQFMKNPPILPKFPSTQGDVVTVATFLSFAELQKQGKTWKLQENLVPIPMSRNSTDVFNKLPIFPQCSQSKSTGEKRSRGRPKVLDTGKAKVSNEIQRNAPNVGTVSCSTEAVKSFNSKGTMNRISPSLSKYDQKGVEPVISSICNDYTCSTATTSIPMQVPIVEKSISVRNCDRITNQKRKPVTTCTNVVDCAKPVTSVVPTNFPLPLNFSSITKPVRICQQQGGSRIFHTMIPCFDFNDAINAGAVPPSAHKINPHILLNPRPTMDKSIPVPQGSMTQQVSMQTLGGTSIYSVPTSNPYICINSEPVFPLTSNSVTSTPKPRILNSRSNQKAKTKQNSKSKSLSAPVLQRTSSPVSAQRNPTPTYREIKPKLSVKTLTPNTSDEVSEETKEVTSDDSDRVSDLLTTNQQLQEPETTSSQKIKNLLRNPRKHTRSLQSNKTLLNEPVDKYIYDNIKKTRRTISSSLKIKMKSVTPQLRFLKNRKQKDMVAELFRNSVGGEIQRSTEISGSPIKRNEKKD